MVHIFGIQLTFIMHSEHVYNINFKFDCFQYIRTIQNVKIANFVLSIDIFYFLIMSLSLSLNFLCDSLLSRYGNDCEMTLSRQKMLIIYYRRTIRTEKSIKFGDSETHITFFGKVSLGDTNWIIKVLQFNATLSLRTSSLLPQFSCLLARLISLMMAYKLHPTSPSNNTEHAMAICTNIILRLEGYFISFFEIVKYEIVKSD